MMCTNEMRLDRRGFLARGTAAALSPLVAGVGAALVSAPSSAAPLNKSKMMNAVALGFIDQDGVADAIPALRAFIKACQQQGQTVGYLPGVPSNKRGYRYVPISTWYGYPDRGLLIPPNFTLIGDDPGTSKFFQDPMAFSTNPVTWPSYNFIFYSSGSSLQNLGFDGQRQLINGGAETSFGSCFIKGAEAACTGAVFKNLVMTNNVGGLQESFCLSTSPQENGTLFQKVVCIGNNGSGISLNGDMVRELDAPGTGLNRNIRVIDCIGSNNTWQGMTAYGCQDSLISNFTGSGNGATKRWAGNGINLEWTYRMRVVGGKFDQNVGAGIGGYGDNDQIIIGSGFTTSNNNLMGSWKSAEISFSSGTWWNQSQGAITGLMRRLTLMKGTIDPMVQNGNPIYALHIDTKDTPSVTFPSRGAPYPPRVVAAGIVGRPFVSNFKLTPFTNPSMLYVRS